VHKLLPVIDVIMFLAEKFKHESELQSRLNETEMTLFQKLKGGLFVKKNTKIHIHLYFTATKYS